MATIGVKIELEGAQAYKKGMSDATNQTKLYQAEAKKLQTEIKNGNGSMQKRIELSNALKNQLKSQREQENLLKAEIERVSQAQGEDSAQVTKLKTQYENLQTQIAKTEASLKEFGGQFGAVGAQFEEFGSKMSAFGNKVTDFGTKYTKAITSTLGAIGVASVKASADFDSSMSQVSATMGFTVEELHDKTSEASKTMDELGKFAQKMGAETAFSASESAQALNYMALAGYDAKTAMEMLPTVLNLASAGGIDLAYASDMVTDAQSALGLSIEDTTTMVDEMAKTASKSNTSVAQLGEAILTVGASARSIKGGTEEINTILGVLADNGIKGAEGGTHLRNMLLALQNPTSDGADALAELGVATYDAEGNMRSMVDIIADMQKGLSKMSAEGRDWTISQIFNKTDLASVNALLNTSTERFDELSEAINNAQGSAQAMADVQLDNFNGQITLLKSAVEGMAISIGTTLTPSITKLVEKIQGLVDKFNALSEEEKEHIVRVGTIIATVGPLLILVGKFITSIGTLSKGIGLIITNMPIIAGAVSSFGAMISATVIPAITGLFTMLLPFIPLIAGITAGVIAVIEVIKHWSEITEFFGQIWEQVSIKFSEVWENIKKKVTEGTEKVKTTVLNLGDKIKESFNNLKEQALNWGRDLIQNFINGIMEKVEYLKQTVANVAQTVADYIHFSEPKKGALSDFNESGGDMMKNFAQGIENAKYLVERAVADVALDINTMLSDPLDYDRIYNAVKEGASSATTKIILNNREVTRALGGMGVVFNG